MSKCLYVESKDNYKCELKDIELSGEAGDVKIKLHYSCLNYKDALALTNKGKILRNYPLVPGIDGAGEVIKSSSEHFPVGSKVLVNGSGFGETRNGGFSEILFSPEDLLVKLPSGLSLRESMCLGTAGFTAALAVHRMEQNGQSPSQGPILVSGASGGVGGLACLLLSIKGYEVHALSSKGNVSNYLMNLGASKVLSFDELEFKDGPLKKARYAGLIDNLGGDFLSKAIGHIDLFGNIASIGLASSHEFSASVMPFILRGVSILGISSANTSMELRREIWSELGNMNLSEALGKINILTSDLANLKENADKLLKREYYGRCIVAL